MRTFPRWPSSVAPLIMPVCLLSGVSTLIVSIRTLPATGASGSATLHIYVTGEQHGRLEPCGCVKPKIGGLARAGGLLTRSPASEPSIKVDNGDWTEARGRQDDLKAEALAQFFTRHNYAAVNLGENDWALGLDTLRFLHSTTRAPFVSANVLNDSGQTVFDTHRTLPAPGATPSSTSTVVIIGLLSTEFEPVVQAANPQLHVESPDKVLEQMAGTFTRGDIFGLLLFHGRTDEAERLARNNAWIRLIVVAHGGDEPITTPERVGNAWIVSIGENGKHLGEVRVAGGILDEYQARQLNQDIPEDPGTQAIMKQYLQKVAVEKLLTAYPKEKTPNGDRFAGTKACAECHKKETKIWSKAKHARAFQTLIDEGHDSDPECVGCHVVGLEYESGFVDSERTPGLVNVGCENCHLPQHKHSLLPYVYRPPKVGATPCKSCHVPDHSPQFEFKKYWEKIKH